LTEDGGGAAAVMPDLPRTVWGGGHSGWSMPGVGGDHGGRQARARRGWCRSGPSLDAFRSSPVEPVDLSRRSDRRSRRPAIFSDENQTHVVSSAVAGTW